MLKVKIINALLVFISMAVSLPMLGQKTQEANDSTITLLKRLTVNELIAPTNLGEIQVVSASRTGSQSLQNLPVTLHVVSKEEIRLHGYTTLVDVLKSIPGMRTSKPGNGTDGELFMMRGMVGNQYAKILINGIPIQSSVKGGIGIGEQLPIAAAERIEIIYGPAAAVYGADAMAGVINIIMQETSSSILSAGNVVTGPGGYRLANFSVGGKVGVNKNVLAYSIYAGMSVREDMNVKYSGHVFNTFDYALSTILSGAPAEQIDAIRKLPDATIVNEIYLQSGFSQYKGTAFTPEMSTLPQKSFYIGSSLKFKNFTFSHNQMYRQDHSSFGRAPLFFSYASPLNYYGEKTQRTALNYQKQWTKWKLLANLSYLRFRTDPGSSFGVTYFNGYGSNAYTFEASDDIFGEALLTYSPNPNWDLLVGASHQASSQMPTTNDLRSPFKRSDYAPFSDKIPSLDPMYGRFGYNPLRVFSTSAFTQAFYHKKRWVVLLGGRFVYASNYQVKETANNNNNSALPNIPAEFSPRMGALFKMSEKASLRFSSAAGFKAPSSSTAFASLALPSNELNGPARDSINYQRIPNPGLSPEISASTEFGFRYSFTNKLFIDAALFTTTVLNRINSQFVTLDRTAYPLALANTRLPNGTLTANARQWVNNAGSTSMLAGLQLYIKGQNLIPKYKLSADLALMLSAGIENLPNGDTLTEYREVPHALMQWNLSLSPVKKMYIRIENVLSSSWLRRNISSASQVNDMYARTSGYYVMDMNIRYELGKNITLSLKVMNVFNTKYAGIGGSGLDIDTFYTPQFLRNIQFGINFSK